MPGARRRGMDHTLYEYSPIPARRTLRWPGDARLAVWVVLYLEHWELAAPADAYRAPGVAGMWPTHAPDYRTYSYREYGNRVGIFRVLDVLDRHHIRATVAANAAACERYPYLVDECRRRGWEFAAHGTHATRMITSRMSEAEEREVIRTSMDTVAETVGRRPVGWIGQDFGESERTPVLVAQAGCRWIGDWPNDDQPYLMTVEPPLVSLPCHAELDDVQLLWLRQVPTPCYPALVREAAATLLREAATGGRMLGLGVHPWLLGQSHRIRYLDEALAGVAGLVGVWTATGEEIAAAFQAAAT